MDRPWRPRVSNRPPGSHGCLRAPPQQRGEAESFINTDTKLCPGGLGTDLIIPFRKAFAAGEFQHCRHHVDHVSRSPPKFTASLNAFWPMYDQRRGSAAFVNPGFVPAKRRVRASGPTRPQAQITAGRTGRSIGIVPIIADHDLGTRPVVGQKENHRVLKRPHRFELSENAADLLIHAVDHRGMDRHFRRLEFPLLLVKSFQASGRLTSPGPSFSGLRGNDRAARCPAPRRTAELQQAPSSAFAPTARPEWHPNPFDTARGTWRCLPAGLAAESAGR